jgi:hypothetical protein
LISEPNSKIALEKCRGATWRDGVFRVGTGNRQKDPGSKNFGLPTLLSLHLFIEVRCSLVQYG